MKFFKKVLRSRFLQIIFVLVIIFLLFWYWPRQKIKPEYGFTFSAKYAVELKLDPRETLEKIFTDLNFKKVRLVAYWDEIEKIDGQFDYSQLDWQIDMAEKYNAEIILAIGKRVPRWPECHIPNWVLNLEQDTQDEYLINYVEQIVSKYKDRASIKLWQVENEPFLTSYAKQYCGQFDKNILDKEIKLVKQIDPDTPILLTDSGELGFWFKTYSRADHFGSTFYMYTANNFFDDMRSIMSHNNYLYKRKIMELFYGKKPSYLIEVSIEPWFTKPITSASFAEQLKKMNTERAETIFNITNQTGFTIQYLWGAEWWFFLKQNGYPELWDYIEELNKDDVI